MSLDIKQTEYYYFLTSYQLSRFWWVNPSFGLPVSIYNYQIVTVIGEAYFWVLDEWHERLFFMNLIMK